MACFASLVLLHFDAIWLTCHGLIWCHTANFQVKPCDSMTYSDQDASWFAWMPAQGSPWSSRKRRGQLSQLKLYNTGYSDDTGRSSLFIWQVPGFIWLKSFWAHAVTFLLDIGQCLVGGNLHNKLYKKLPSPKLTKLRQIGHAKSKATSLPNINFFRGKLPVSFKEGTNGVSCASHQPLQATIWLMLRFLSNTFLVWQWINLWMLVGWMFHHWFVSPQKRWMFVNLEVVIVVWHGDIWEYSFSDLLGICFGRTVCHQPL